MDNYYNSVELSEDLLSRKTHTTGTLRKKRKGNPKAVVDCKLKKGEHVWRRSGDIHVSKWKDKRDVLFISTANNPELIEVPNKFGQLKMKPKAIADYNENMSGIDRCDEMVQYYSSPRKTIRWYKKILFHLWNSYYIYKKMYPKETFLKFRDNIIQSLLQLPANVTNGADLIKTRTGRPKTSVLPETVEPGPSYQPSDQHRVVFQHYPEKIPAPEGYKRKTYFLRRKECWKNNVRKETYVRCKGCPDKPALCPTCFESYHENNEYYK
ncbi:unnamed protein product [Acanthoscelides obtectus]|uniref:PiggyBac transposable element-derived protein domain-containing protein n=1 Tax=Acanthoscelides obtectus TaxID=200917 RepID=A0A9P0JS00_ACAOB|nr:unnamed protein product [Acanthoscelides obtectus]CAK1668118.1 PiggyBac transposable element-derived protein 4 [Acanthoscelides obtectus]